MTRLDNAAPTIDAQAKKRFKGLFWASIGVIAAVTIIVFLMALAFPQSIPGWSEKIKSAGVFFLVIRWSIYAGIYFKFTALCNYLAPAASHEKITYAKKHVVGLMIFYELIVGVKVLQYGFDFFFNSSVGI